MVNRTAFAMMTLFLIGIVCCSSPRQEETALSEKIDPNEVVRTADPYKRGYTEEDFPRIQELADGVYSYEQLRSAGNEKFTTVSLFVVTKEGVLVADGQGGPEETARLVDEIAEITDQPISYVVICSDHGDHTAGNVSFPQEAVFFAHPTSKANLETVANRLKQPDDAPPVIIPTELVEGKKVLELGDKEIHILFLGRAHTGGDLTVYLPEDKLLFMSEAYLNRVFPAMRSAYATEWVATIEKAQAMDVEIYVPGHGFVDSPKILKEELEIYRRALVLVIEEAKRLHAAGRSADEAAEEARFGELESWSLRSSQATRAIHRVYMELNKELPPQ